MERGLRGWSNGYVRIGLAMRVARVFDGVRDGEPYFLPEHPRADDPRLVAYLGAGRVILGTEGRDLDRLDPARGSVVPLGYRTDGEWIWTDTITYYLEHHRIRPDEDLCVHIATRGFRCPQVDEATARHALGELRSGG